MARKYLEAEREFESVIKDIPFNKIVRTKLIVCYAQTKKLKLALDHFRLLLSEDINFLIEADPQQYDIPCDEILNDLDRSNFYSDQFGSNLHRGILWFYCDINKSLEYLAKAHELCPRDPKLNEVLAIIRGYLKEHPTSHA
jgi:hypothetical protein